MTTTPLLNQSTFWGAAPLFKDVSTSDLDDLFALTTQHRASAGEPVVRQGDAGADLFVILKGKARVSISIADGEEVSLGELNAGEAFGEIALLDGRPRTATVVAAEPCEFCVLKRDAFCGFLLSHPHAAISILAAMAERLRRSDGFIKDALYNSVTARLADTLRKLAQAYGKHTRDGLHIDLKFSERELSEIAGVPTSVVAAQLRQWSDAGHIKTRHGGLTLIHPEDLSHL